MITPRAVLEDAYRRAQLKAFEALGGALSRRTTPPDVLEVAIVEAMCAAFGAELRALREEVALLRAELRAEKGRR